MLSAMAIIALIVVLLVHSFAAASFAQQAPINVGATYKDYNSQQHNWDLSAVSAYCSTWDASRPLLWRKQYKWTSFCSSIGTRTHDQVSCRRCLKEERLIGEKTRQWRRGRKATEDEEEVLESREEEKEISEQIGEPSRGGKDGSAGGEATKGGKTVERGSKEEEEADDTN